MHKTADCEGTRIIKREVNKCVTELISRFLTLALVRIITFNLGKMQNNNVTNLNSKTYNRSFPYILPFLQAYGNRITTTSFLTKATSFLRLRILKNLTIAFIINHRKYKSNI